MKKLNRILALILALCMAFALVACSSGGDTDTGADTNVDADAGADTEVEVDDAFVNGPTITIRYAEEGNEYTARYAAAEYLSDILYERSGGKIILELYPNGVMGTAFEVVASVEAGDIEMTSFDAGAIVSESLSILDAPGIFSDIDVATAVLTGDNEFMAMVDEELANLNLKNLFMAPACYRLLTTTDAEISSVADIKGLVVRVPNNSMFISFWEAMGASTQVISASETYLALQQGVVDAQENPLDQCVNVYKFCEVQQYMYLTNHIMAKQCLMINLDFYNSLPEEYRQLLDECVAEYGDYYIQARDLEMEQLLADAEAQGAEIVEMSDDFYAEQTAVSEAVMEEVRQLSGDEMVDACLAAIAEAENNT